jgi:tRNA(fMet)-specific endonuclease VapC
LRYLFDTNALKAAIHEDPRMLMRMEGLRALDIGLPQPVIAEVEFGIARLPKSRKREALRAAAEITKAFYPRSSWTDEVSEQFGEMKALLQSQGQPVEDFDVAIAAHAIVEGATLVTANTRHFERIPGLKIENWLDTH